MRDEKKTAEYKCENIIRRKTSIINSNKNAPPRSEVSRLKLPSFADATCGYLSGTANRSYLSSSSRASSPPARPRVNVYLCIKQALFIRPMNMHCLVAVARCRVQTRRYHCLINHIQSHRFTLCPPALSLHPPPFSPFRRAVPTFPVLRFHHPSRRRGPAVSSLKALRAFSLIVLSRSLRSLALLRSPLTRCFPSRQPATIDINLRNFFFGASTCHRVTAHPQPGVPDAGAECAGMRFAGRGTNEDKRGRSVESPNGHSWFPRGDI